MPVTNVFAEMTVTDFDAALVWYGRLLGRPADETPMPGLAQWHLTESGGIRLFRDAEHAGGGLMTLVVDDLAAHVAELAGRGLAVGAITTGDVARFAAVTDPEGNTITFAELLGGAG